MKYITIFLAQILLTCFFVHAQDARQISKNAENAIRIESFEMISTLKIFNAKGDERSRTITTATKKFGDETKTLLRFIDPADVKGTTLLIIDYENRNDDMWIFMPALRKTRRIVSSEKGKYFMGSEFTHADMSRPNFDDFSYKLVGEETVDGEGCWKIESACANKTIENENGFSKRVAFIDQKDNLTRKVEYIGSGGELLRTQLIKDYRKQKDGSYFAFFMEMRNAQNGRRSTLTINQFQPGSSLSESSFSPTLLEN